MSFLLPISDMGFLTWKVPSLVEYLAIKSSTDEIVCPEDGTRARRARAVVSRSSGNETPGTCAASSVQKWFVSLKVHLNFKAIA